MADTEDLDARALADRTVNYSDALVALMFISASGLGIALADPDIRGSINLVTGWMITGNVMLGVIISALLVVLRRWEQDLRGAARVSAKVQRYSRHYYWARQVVVWLAVGQVCLVLALSTLD